MDAAIRNQAKAELERLFQNVCDALLIDRPDLYRMVDEIMEADGYIEYREEVLH